MMTLVIILIIIGIISLILGIVLECRLYNDILYIFLCFLAFLILIDVVLIVDNKIQNPQKQDVLDGKAIYQETQVITGNDTIKTYEIVWKQKN